MKLKSIALLVVAAAVLAFAAGVQAQAWPTKPIKIIVPFPPGNTMDIMSRLIAPKLQERLGQPIIVENRPGASGMLGLDLVVKSPPDGYTIGAGQGGNLCVAPAHEQERSLRCAQGLRPDRDLDDELPRHLRQYRRSPSRRSPR